jgi:tetratricopeptide (TPR) repeat protein
MSCSLFWVHATSEARFTADYTIIAKQAGLKTELKGAELLTAVCNWLKKQTNWLLVLDNADDIRLFKDEFPRSDKNESTASPSLLQYVPQTSAGSILWTTRDGKIGGSLVGQNQSVMVGKMTSKESLKLLRHSNANEDSHEFTPPSVDEERLLGPEGLDGLPLAITQAEKFMAATDTSVTEYIQMFNESQQEVLDEEYPDEYRSEMPNSVMQTFLISMKAITTEGSDGEIAGRILKTIAFFDNQGIPIEIIEQAASSESGNQQLSKFRIQKILRRIMEYSFLQPQEEVSGQRERGYVQHPLLQLSMRLSLSPQETHDFGSEASEIMRGLFPNPKVENWSLCKKYFPHSLKITDSIESEMLDVNFLVRIGQYCYQQGLYPVAEKFLSRAFELGKNTLGQEHVDTIMAMHELAIVWEYQGQFGKAEPLQAQVLELWKGVLGEKHPDTIIAMDNLASTWVNQGHLEKAETLRVQVLELRKEVLGEKHPDTIRAMNNLASTWVNQGHLEKAETLRVQVLELWKEVLGEKHPDTMIAMDNLASTLADQGHLEKAESLQVQALELRKELLGEKHPDTVKAMNNLASNLAYQGHLEKAEPLQVQVLQLRKEVLGDKHPDTLLAMANLAASWYGQKLYIKEKEMEIEVLKMRISISGERHPDTRLDRRNLAYTCLAQEALDEAYALWEKEAEIDLINPHWQSTPWVQETAEEWGFKMVPTAGESGSESSLPPTRKRAKR